MTGALVKKQGFTLIEMALVVLILGILATIALPEYRDYTEKARLTDLELRVDAMRTAMATAYQTGVRSMMRKAAYAPGIIPEEWRAIPIRDSMTYPGLEMFMMTTDQPFGQQLPGGTMRPYLVLGAAGSVSGDIAESARTLRNFSEIFPASRQAWWVPSTIMVIPLLDDTTLRIANTSATNPATPANTAGSSGPAPGTGSPSPADTGAPAPTNTGGPAAQTAQGGGTQTGGTVAGNTGTGTAPANTGTGTPAPSQVVNNPPVVPVVESCSHPGQGVGHAWGHCNGHGHN